MPKEFIDKFAMIGRAKLAPKSETTVKAISPSRSIAVKNKQLHCEIRQNGSLLINNSSIIGDRIKISKTDAIKFATWILKTYGRKV